MATFSNADPYMWVSQARTLLEGTPSQAAFRPDSIPYERIRHEEWPTGIPLTLGGLAWLSNSDPVEVYGAFAVLLTTLLALTVFFCARGVLLWSSSVAALAGILVGTNGYLLFGNSFGWQAQIALATFGLLSVFWFRAALDREGSRRERVGAAAFGAAAIAAYGWPYVSFGAFLVAAGVAYLVSHGRRYLGRTFKVASEFGLWLALIGAVQIVQAIRSLGFVDRSPEIVRRWSAYDPALPSDSLGLIPRTQALKQSSPNGWILGVVLGCGIVAVALPTLTAKVRALNSPLDLLPIAIVLVTVDLVIIRVHDASPAAWAFCADVVTALLLGTGLAFLRSSQTQHGDLLVAGAAFLFAELAFFSVFHETPFYSVRLMGYAAPIFTLIALSVLTAGPSLKPMSSIALVRRLLLSASAAFALLGTITAIREGRDSLRTTAGVEAIAKATNDAVEPSSVIEIDIAETWNQAWLVYFLRDRELAVSHPSVYFTGLSATGSHALPTPANVEYRIQAHAGRQVAAKASGFFLNRIQPH
ncbi:MAG: hypothetical protein H0X39_09345 [Actinobacteria bacterium]|nr:hypothetical protein [Actinomycetota bacterium]